MEGRDDDIIYGTTKLLICFCVRELTLWTICLAAEGAQKHYKSGGSCIEGHFGRVSGSEIEHFACGVKHVMKRQNIVHDGKGSRGMRLSEISKLRSAAIAGNVHFLLFVASSKFSRETTKVHEKGTLLKSLKSRGTRLLGSPSVCVHAGSIDIELPIKCRLRNDIYREATTRIYCV